MTDIPKIRFKGFTEDWERRRLIEIMQRITRKNQDLESELPLTISSQYGLIDQNEFFDKRIASKDVRGYYLVRKGEFAYNKSTSNDAPWGAVKRLDRYEKGVLSTLYIVFGINDETKTNSDYIVTYYDTNLWHKGVQAIAAEGARNHGLLNITPADFFETTLMIPQDIKEQKRIGYFFKELNQLITLHQHKCDETKELKKYMLQKMFPKNGEKIPEIRFAGFTDDWEQRKLNEIAEKVTEKNKNNIYHEPLTNSAEMGIISQKDYFDREIVNKENLEDYYVVRNDDFVYNPRVSVTAPVGPINRNRLSRNGIMSPLYTVFRTHDIDVLYLEYYFKTTNWHRFMKLNGDSGARFDRFTISTSKFMEMPIPYPDLEEQIKIGQYFDSLDHLITLHQRKCDALKEVKKFMLQNMFPQKG